MRTLTRTEHEALLDLLNVVLDNGRGALIGTTLPNTAITEVRRLVHCVRCVRDAVQLDLVNQEEQ